VAAPLTIPSAPVVNVVNNCGNSVLSTTATGTLLWSPGGQSTSQITVTTAGTYSVTQTVGGCTSPAGSGVAAPIAVPVVSLGNDTTICLDASLVLNAGNPGATYLWSPGGQTTQTITVDSTGLSLGMHSFSVQVTKNGCIGSDAINITLSACAGIEELSNPVHVSILPNPSNGLFRIQTTGLEGNLDLHVYNISGQVLYSVKMETSGINNHTIDLRGLAKGMYFVRITSQDKVFTEKLMVE
jgi:hypothetical protein